MSISDEIKAAKKAAATAVAVKSEAVEVVLNDVVREVIVYRAPSKTYREAMSGNPPSMGNFEDSRVGYSVEGVALALLPEFGRIIDGDDEVELSAEEWADLHSVQPAHVQRELEGTVWAVNDMSRRVEVEALKKASTARSKRKRG